VRQIEAPEIVEGGVRGGTPTKNVHGVIVPHSRVCKSSGDEGQGCSGPAIDRLLGEHLPAQSKVGKALLQVQLGAAHEIWGELQVN